MNGTTVRFRTVLVGIILTVLWICCFLFIKPTLAIQFGPQYSSGFNVNLKLLVILLGLLIIVLYHIFDRPNAETTKLSLTAALTVVWLSLIIFYPFNPPANLSDTQAATWPGGAMGFFTLIGGLGICVLWVRFFADEIV